MPVAVRTVRSLRKVDTLQIKKLWNGTSKLIHIVYFNKICWRNEVGNKIYCNFHKKISTVIGINRVSPVNHESLDETCLMVVVS